MIRKGEPITELGLTFHPITMSDYELFLATKDALTIRQSSLPVRYITLDYLQALFAIDMDALNSPDGKSGGMFCRMMMFLCLSLRIDDEKDLLTKGLYVRKSPDGETVLDHIRIEQDGRAVDISTAEFAGIVRPLLAEMNGLTLPDESESLDIVKGGDEVREHEQNGRKNLKADISDLISSVAYKSGVSDREIDRWTVREFESRRRAIERDKYHLVYALAELSGLVRFEKGNPVPSWCYDAIDDSYGTKALAEVGKTLGGLAQQ